MVFDQRAAGRRLHRALVAAILALHRARDVEPAQLLDGVIEHAVAENVVPGIGEEPEAAGTWARIAELSGRGVPSRWQRSISARILASIFSSGT